MPATETQKPPIDIDKSFGYLTKAIGRVGQQAHIRIGAHIRAITNGKINALGVYHATPTISTEEKHQTYKLCFNALIKKGGPDWKELQGQEKIGLGHAEAQVEPPKRSVKPKDAKASEGGSRIDPLAEAEKSPAGARRIADIPKHNDEPEISSDESADPLTKAIINAVRKHVKVTAGTDEARVDEICRGILSEFETDYDGKFHDKVAKAMSNGAFPVDRVQKMLDVLKGELAEGMVKRVELITPDGSIKPFAEVVHEMFPVLVQMAQARRVNILMVGPTGSGKTTAAEQLSKALELEFFFNGAIDTEYKLKGFLDAQGRLVSPAFRKAFEKGGVYLFDEVDASLPAAVLAFNAALSNHYCDFPDGKIERHKDCVIIAAGNTWMGGGTFDYVGRMKQDAAFADRFATLSWPIDEKMEMAAATNKGWCKYVQAIRANVIRHGLKVIVSPRATFFGEQLLACKVNRKQVIASVIRKGMTDDQWKAVKQPEE